MGPDSIMYHLGRHAEAIDRLTTQVSALEAQSKRRKKITHHISWRDLLPYLWGSIMLLMAWLTPQTVEKAAELIKLARG